MMAAHGDGEWMGYLAAMLTTLAFVPQAIQVIRSKDTRGISLPMYVIFTAGVACWVGYGVALGSWPMIVANLVTIALALVILALKCRYG
jgi:MtN3 and saliva related transmembrane protein